MGRFYEIRGEDTLTSKNTIKWRNSQKCKKVIKWESAAKMLRMSKTAGRSDIAWRLTRELEMVFGRSQTCIYEDTIHPISQ